MKENTDEPIEIKNIGKDDIIISQPDDSKNRFEINTESAPFLTEEDCNKYIHETFDGLHNDYTHLKEAAINGWQQAANKANATIAELEKRLADVEKEREDLRLWKESEMAMWGPIIEYCQSNREKLQLPIGASISEWILDVLMRLSSMCEIKGVRGNGPDWGEMKITGGVTTWEDRLDNLKE